MTIFEIVIVRADNRRPIVMDDNSFPILLERFHAPHIHRIFVMAKIKFILYSASTQRLWLRMWSILLFFPHSFRSRCVRRYTHFIFNIILLLKLNLVYQIALLLWIFIISNIFTILSKSNRLECIKWIYVYKI